VDSIFIIVNIYQITVSCAMKIDYQATKQNIFDTGRTVAGWSRLHGLNAKSVAVFLVGKFVTNNPGSGIYAQIVTALKEDGFLVQLPEDDHDQAA